MAPSGMLVHVQARLAEPALAVPCRRSWLHRRPFTLRAVLRRWRRLPGMIVGVGIALGFAMTLTATSSASVDFLAGDYRVSGADLYVHTEGGTLLPLLPGEGPGTIQHARDVLSKIRGLPGVTSAFGAMTWPLERERPGPRRRANEATELVAVVGVDGQPESVPGAVVIRSGRWLRRADEIVVGTRLAREKHLALGDVVRLSGRDFQVVGIGRLRGVGWGSDGFAYLDARSLRQRAQLGDVLNVVVVETTRPDLARERIPQIGTLVVERPEDLVRRVKAMMRSAVVMQAILVGMTLAIAGLFVANMLGRSVATRRLELATLRAIGVGSRVILVMVAGEAVLVCLLASLVGIAVSLFLGWLINAYMAPFYGIESLYLVDRWTFVTVVLLAVALGALAGLAPARRATRVDPVDVLREA